jgi:hypothetical protein
LVQIRDLDQAVIGNPVQIWCGSVCHWHLHSADSDLPGVTTARILEELVVGYQDALSTGFETDKDKSHRPKPIQTLLAQSARRRWRHPEHSGRGRRWSKWNKLTPHVWSHPRFLSAGSISQCACSPPRNIRYLRCSGDGNPCSQDPLRFCLFGSRWLLP